MVSLQTSSERTPYERFLECLDRVNRAIAGAGDLEEMMSEVLGVVLTTFECDRAFLLFPCDPTAPSWRVPMERTKPEYPGVLALNLQIPLGPDVADTFRRLLAAPGPIKFGPGTDNPLPADAAERFGFKTFLSMALRPKGGQPWQFGIHQCSHVRVWTDDDVALFEEIGRRLTDGLSMLLAQRDLARRKARLEETQRRAQIGYWYCDLAADRIELGDEACRIVGLTPGPNSFAVDEWRAQWDAIVHPADRSWVARAWGEMLSSGRYSVDCRVVRASGEIRFIHSEASLERDDLGRPRRALGLIQDVTDRQRADIALRESEQRYRMLFESSPAALREEDYSAVKGFFDQLRSEGVTDLARYFAEHEGALVRCVSLVKVENVNQAALALHGATDKRELLTGVGPIFAEQTLPLFQALLETLWRGETAFSRDVVLVTIAGKPIQVSTLLSICPGYEETFGRVLVVLTDITERTNVEATTRRLNLELERRVAERTAELQAANAELEAFAYSVSHDLRAPLRHINGFVELLERRFVGEIDVRTKHYLDTIVGATRRMGQLIDDLLSFSRMGRAELSRRRVDLGALVRDVLREMEPETKGRSVKWVVGALPVVTGDSELLRSALTNLVSNALKFTRPRDEARIEIGGGRTAPQEGGEAIVFVRDNGVGFDMKYADKLFGVFQRLHSAREFEGTGIGLANVRRIISRHGGRTWAEATPGGGATFYLSLPLVSTQ